MTKYDIYFLCRKFVLALPNVVASCVGYKFVHSPIISIDDGVVRPVVGRSSSSSSCLPGRRIIIEKSFWCGRYERQRFYFTMASLRNYLFLQVFRDSDYVFHYFYWSFEYFVFYPLENVELLRYVVSRG